MKKKLGRPSKRDHGAFMAAFGHMAEMTDDDFDLTKEESQQAIKSRLLTDPLMNDPVMGIFSPCITGDASEGTREFVGLLLADALKELKAEQLGDLFDRILKRKREAEKADQEGPHRVFYAYQAYCDFTKEFGFEPTKQKLKDFMLGRSIYVDIPTEDDTKAWSELFKMAGLSELDPGFWPKPT